MTLDSQRLTKCIPKDTIRFMIEIRQTDQYAHWFKKLKDPRAKAKIDIRIRRLSLGNPGDVEPIGKGLSELRIDYGPGYRVYFMKQGDEFVLLLAGGDKSSQRRDIKLAHKLAENT